MIITKVPLRVSIAGGSTDLPGYYLNRDHGEVINFPINKHIYINPLYSIMKIKQILNILK